MNGYRGALYCLKLSRTFQRMAWFFIPGIDQQRGKRAQRRRQARPRSLTCGDISEPDPFSCLFANSSLHSRILQRQSFLIDHRRPPSGCTNLVLIGSPMRNFDSLLEIFQTYNYGVMLGMAWLPWGRSNQALESIIGIINAYFLLSR